MKTLFVGQNKIHLKSVDSTNSYAIELLRQNRPVEGTLIYTFEQENGRGQRGSTWECEPTKNAALSLVLYPLFLAADKQFILTKIISLAVADLMSELFQALNFNYPIQIKWPNDIYVNDKKIAGILIENHLRENSLQSSVIGIGININQTEFKSTSNAASLKLLTDKEFDMIPIVERLCEFIEAYYLQLKANKQESINFAYLQRLYKLNEWANFSSDNQIFEGKISGVALQGKLQVQLKSNEVKEFDLKQISFV